ncbi:hypothetical protein Syun_031503 [Stephania yunnanensis]|uniref:Uncharacterized protein n=1 Tax=Stephania yunnanensis TaxID=152371 RepID=A0AAP0E8C5_9MAGN
MVRMKKGEKNRERGERKKQNVTEEKEMRTREEEEEKGRGWWRGSTAGGDRTAVAARMAVRQPGGDPIGGDGVRTR